MPRPAEFEAPSCLPSEWKRDVFGAPEWLLFTEITAWGPFMSILPKPAKDATGDGHEPRGPLLLPHLFPLVRKQRNEWDEWVEVRKR